MPSADRDLRLVGTLDEVTMVDGQQFLEIEVEMDDSPVLSIADPDSIVTDDFLGSRVILDVAISAIESIEPAETDTLRLSQTAEGTAYLRGVFESQTLQDDVLSAEVDLGIGVASVPYHEERFEKLSKMREIARDYGIADADYVQVSGAELELVGIDRADEASPYTDTPMTDIEFRLEYDTSFERQVVEEESASPLVDFRFLAGETYVVGAEDGRWADDYMTWHLEGLLDCCREILDGTETGYHFAAENREYEFTPTSDPVGVRMQYKTGDFQLNRDLPKDGILLDRRAFVEEIVQTAKEFHETVCSLAPTLESDLESLREAIDTTEIALAAHTAPGEDGSPGTSDGYQSPLSTFDGDCPPGTLPVKLIDCIPSTVYQGTVYDQLVVFEAGDTRFGAFDMNMLVPDSALEDWLAVELQLFLPSVEQAPDRDPGIEPASGDRDWRDHTVVGTAHWRTDEETETLFLDVGPGEIRVATSELDYEIADGERIAVTASRLDVDDVATTLSTSAASDSFENYDTDALCAVVTDADAPIDARIGALTELEARGDPDAIPALTTVARQAVETNVCTTAIDALAAIETPEAVDALSELLTAGETTPTAQRAVLRKLRSQESTRVIEPVRDTALDASDPDVRRLAVTVLAAIAGERAFEPLLDVLDTDENEAVVHEAASALATTDHPDLPTAFETRMRTADDQTVRTAIVETVTRSHDWAVEVLLEALYDESPDVQRKAIFRAQWQDDSRIVEPLCRLIQSNDDPLIRERAVRAFTEIEPEILSTDERRYVAETLVDALGDPESNIRSAALSGLRSHAHPVAFGPLCEVVRDTETDDSQLEDALTALSRIDDDRVTPLVIDHLSHSSSRVRNAACRACSRLDATEMPPDLLDRATSDEDPNVRETAIQAVKNLESTRQYRGIADTEGSTELVARLEEIALTDTEQSVQRAGVRALDSLQHLQDTNQAATDALERITDADVDAEVRERAAYALE